VGWEINVRAAQDSDGWTCHVKVETGGRTVTEHTVIVTKSEAERLSAGPSVEDLVERSFAFLLEREQPQSILKRFSLSDIETYFPDYPRVIKREL
jgi:hypothetical protein